MTATPPEQAWFAKADEDLEIARREDQARFDGRYRTRDLILVYTNALDAGDTKFKV